MENVNYSKLLQKEVIKSGIELAIEKNIDLEDILQCLCAKENGCGYLITNDKNFMIVVSKL